jgi:hypothetical protein
MIMAPEPGNAHEAEGVLNPGVVRGPDGQLYLFPRLVARATTRESALRGSSSMTPEIQLGSNAWALPWNPRKIASADPRVVVAAKIHA